MKLECKDCDVKCFIDIPEDRKNVKIEIAGTRHNLECAKWHIIEEPQPDRICDDCKFRGNCDQPEPKGNKCMEYVKDLRQEEPDLDKNPGFAGPAIEAAKKLCWNPDCMESIRLLTEQVNYLLKRTEAVPKMYAEIVELQKRVEALEDCAHNHDPLEFEKLQEDVDRLNRLEKVGCEIDAALIKRIEALEKQPVRWIESPMQPGDEQGNEPHCRLCQFLAPKCGIVGGRP